MASPSALASFRIIRAGNRFEIEVTDAAGVVLTVLASLDDLEIIADALDDILIGGET